MRAKTALTAIALTAMIALTGCTDEKLTATLSKDGTVTGSFDYLMARNAVKLMSQTDVNADGDINEADSAEGLTPLSVDDYVAKVFDVEEVTADLAAAGVTNTTVTRVSSDDDKYVGFRFVFDQASLRSFNALGAAEDSEDGALFSLVRKAGKATFKFHVFPDLTQDPHVTTKRLPRMKYKVKMTFSGKVIETNGRVSGKTVTWSGEGARNEKVLRAVALSPR